MKKLAIGLMTGSSMDGIDAAILESDGRFHARHIAGASLEYSSGFKLALRLAEYAVQQEGGQLKAANSNFHRHAEVFAKKTDITPLLKDFEATDISEILLQSVIAELTKKHAEIVSRLLRESALQASQIAVIGFHGQNLYHNPTIKTLQIGDGQLLADLTGIAVVNNFRHNDVSNGGQGAPFAPLYHFALANIHNTIPVAIINCGGIANITAIYDNNPENIVAFDTGPGNVLVDRYLRQATNNKLYMDQDGALGKNGVLNKDLLEELDRVAIGNYPGSYSSLLPPKSLDTRHFVLPEMVWRIKREDVCATLEYFTAFTIVKSLDLCVINMQSRDLPQNYVLAGGGWKNPVIYKYFVDLLKEKIASTRIMVADDLGWSSQYMEAEIFAYLAVRNINDLPISLPNVTGARIATRSNNFYKPNNANLG